MFGRLCAFYKQTFILNVIHSTNSIKKFCRWEVFATWSTFESVLFIKTISSSIFSGWVAPLLYRSMKRSAFCTSADIRSLFCIENLQILQVLTSKVVLTSCGISSCLFIKENRASQYDDVSKLSQNEILNLTSRKLCPSVSFLHEVRKVSTIYTITVHMQRRCSPSGTTL